MGRTEASPDESTDQKGKMGDKKLGFFENFMLAGVAAGVSKTWAAPIERVKLLVQNQDEMIKQGRLDKPYTGVLDCTKRVLATEGIVPFWRGNLANVLRYLPTQALNFAFKDTIKALFATPKDASPTVKFATNIALVVSPEPCPFCSCTLLTLPGPGWPTTTRARVESVSSTVSRASTEASPSLLLVSSSTAACTSVCSIP